MHRAERVADERLLAQHAVLLLGRVHRRVRSRLLPAAPDQDVGQRHGEDGLGPAADLGRSAEPVHRRAGVLLQPQHDHRAQPGHGAGQGGLQPPGRSCRAPPTCRSTTTSRHRRGLGRPAARRPKRSSTGGSRSCTWPPRRWPASTPRRAAVSSTTSPPSATSRTSSTPPTGTARRPPDAISCVASTHWTSHQRHKQYQGAHNATYNGVTLNIDSRCADAAGVRQRQPAQLDAGVLALRGSASTRSARHRAHRPAAAGQLARHVSGRRAARRLTRARAEDARDRGSPTAQPAAHRRATGGAGRRRAGRAGDRARRRGALHVHRRHRTSRVAPRWRSPAAARPGRPGAHRGAVRLAGAGASIPDARHAQIWSPTGTTRFAVKGLPGLPESLRFTGARDGVAVVEAGGTAPARRRRRLPRLYRTSDGGRSWHAHRLSAAVRARAGCPRRAPWRRRRASALLSRKNSGFCTPA